MHSLWPQDPQVVLKISSWKTVGDLCCELQGKALAQPSHAMWLWVTYLSFWSPNVKQGLMILLAVSPGFPMLCLQGLCLCSSGRVVSTERFMVLIFLLSTLPSVIRYQMDAINI